MVDYNALAESIGFLLDDLNIPGTQKLTGEEIQRTEKDGVPATFSTTCGILLSKLAHYDISIQNVTSTATVREIYTAFAKRGPHFTVNGINTSSNPSLLQYRFLHFLTTNLQAERLYKRSEGDTERLESAGERGKLIFQLDKICHELQVVPDQNLPDESNIIEAITAKVSNIINTINIDDNHVKLFNNPPLAIHSDLDSNADVNANANTVTLTDEQKQQLEMICNVYQQDFQLRRRMLMKRLDVTIQSFLWGESAQGKEGDIVAAIQAHRKHLSEIPNKYNYIDALSAPISLLHEHSKKVTDMSGKSLVKTVIIGSVPDRGGRANEMRPKKADFGFGGGHKTAGGGGGYKGGNKGKGGGGGGGNKGKGGGANKGSEKK
jgi:hypothetical protein